MGCGTSTSKSGVLNGSVHKKVSRPSKSDDVSMSDDDLTMANETLRMRQERDQQVFKEIQAEKAALRAIASVIIEQRSSCENLLDLLETPELEDLKENPNTHQLQKAATVKVTKAQKDKKRRWVMYNNVDAIDSQSIEKVAEFMNYSIIGACDSEHLDHNDGEEDFNLAQNTAANATKADDFMPPALTLTSPTAASGGERNEFATRRDSRRMSISKDLRNVTDRHETYEYGSSPTSSPQRTARRKSLKLSGSSVKYNLDADGEEGAATITIPNTKGSNGSRALPMTPTTPLSVRPANTPTSIKRANSVVAPAEVDPDLKRQLLSMNILTVKPQSSFRISDNNIFDYDFPPGLVTIGVAAAVIELFKRGGRLTPKSVHKLLRLGYRSFKSRPNTNKINLGPTDRLTVVGDIHGQLSDLLHIVDSVGLPSSSNRYLFNGDFVDRGAYGVEVMCVLLVLHAAMPEYVTLNRGNHEDYAICTAYGFQVECFEKYGELIFGMFVEVFQQIPLFTIINDAVFVLHGGLFHTRDALLSELNAIKRTTFSLEDLPEGGEGITEVPRFKRKEYLKQLVRDALWSDPVDKTGTHPSIRGAGVGFGPDVTRIFLNTNKLKFVVRSHECVRSGYNEPYTGENQPLLCTIFSASDYGSSGNSAAYMIFKVTDPTTSSEAAGTTSATTTPPHNSSRSPSVSSYTAGEEEACSVSEVKHVRNCNLSYTVHYFYIDAEFRDGDRINNLHKGDVHMNTGGRVFSREVYDAQYGGGGFGVSPTSTGSTEALAVQTESVSEGEVHIHISDEYDSSKRPHNKSRLSLSCCASQDTVLVGLSISLYELILEKKYALQEVFAVLDPRGEGVVTKSQFSMVLHDVLKVPVQWIRLLQVLLEENQFKMHHGKRLIDYAAFLNQFLELTTVPKGDVESAEEEDPNLDALGRYLKAMEKSVSSSAAGKAETKKLEETVKAIRTSSASAIDVSHHQRNMNSQFDKFSSIPTAASKAKDDLGKPFVPKPKELKPLDLAPKPPAPVYVSAGNRGRTASGSLESVSMSAKHLPFPPVTPTTGEEQKQGEGDEEDEEEGNSYYNYLVTEGLLDVLYTDFLRLEQTFQFFDRDKKGYFTRADLQTGLEEMARTLPSETHLPSVDELMRVLDVHSSGEIDMNLFFEMHRICDLSLKAHIDDDDSVDETAPVSNPLSRDQSMDNLVRRMSVGGTAMLNAQQMQVLQQAQISPNSPTHHHAIGVRNDSNASLAIKGVNINVDELTTVNTISNVESRAESRKIAAAAATGLDI